MSFTVYLTHDQIKEKYDFDPRSDLYISDQLEVEEQKVNTLIAAVRDYQESGRQWTRFDNQFWEKYKVIPERATEEMKASYEYQALESVKFENAYCRKVMDEIQALGYEMRLL